ncbi:hypothetical protein AB0D08_08455 [Kitasatospora sp. NPDC048540]|uniref:hypothetical protein n=1 Tax=Kitasatospora sp. NPDC048540 TaxID=3155634 RepID=UPI0033E9F6A6
MTRRSPAPGPAVAGPLLGLAAVMVLVATALLAGGPAPGRATAPDRATAPVPAAGGPRSQERAP